MKTKKSFTIGLIVVLLVLLVAAVFVSQELSQPESDQSAEDSSAYLPGDRTACGQSCSSNADCDAVTVCNQSTGTCMSPNCSDVGGLFQCRNNGCTYEVPSTEVVIYMDYPGYDRNSRNSQQLEYVTPIGELGQAQPNCVLDAGNAFAGQDPGPWILRLWKGDPPDFTNNASINASPGYQRNNWGGILGLEVVDIDPAIDGQDIWMCCVEVESIDRNQLGTTGKIGQCVQFVEEIETPGEEPEPLDISKSAAPATSSDGFFSYTVTVSNNNNTEVNNIIVTDVSDDLLIPWIISGSIETSTGQLTGGTGELGIDSVWDIGTLAAGATATLTYDIQVPINQFSSISSGATNVATVYVDENGNGEGEATEEQDQDSETVFVDEPNDGIEKTATITSQSETSATVRYSITFNPTSNYSDLIIADRLDPDVEIDWVRNISGTGGLNLFTCDDLGYTAGVDCQNTIGWTGLSASSGELINLNYEVVVPAASFGTYQNFAIAYDDSGDNDNTPSPEEEIDRDDALVTVDELATTPDNLPQTALPGDDRMYLIVVLLLMFSIIAYRLKFANDTIESWLMSGIETAEKTGRVVGKTKIAKKLGGKRAFERRLTNKD